MVSHLILSERVRRARRADSGRVVAAPLHRDLPFEVEDACLLPADGRVLVLLALGVFELVSEQTGFEDAEIGPAGVVALASHFGGGEDHRPHEEEQ